MAKKRVASEGGGNNRNGSSGRGGSSNSGSSDKRAAGKFQTEARAEMTGSRGKEMTRVMKVEDKKPWALVTGRVPGSC